MEYDFTIFTENNTGLTKAIYAGQLAEFFEHEPEVLPLMVPQVLCRPYLIVARPPKSLEAVGGVTVQAAFTDEQGLSWQQISALAAFPGHTGNGLETRLVEVATAIIGGLEGNNAFADFRSNAPSTLSAFHENGFIDEGVAGLERVVKYCGRLSFASAELVAS